ncbi:phage portal protein family protein [Micromonospora wenchangensis]|uniref:phage portal protein family protein n=1 Tax=Micromonospora wenchangensis TaxID=1185415 RepID=UPI00381630BE
MITPPPTTPLGWVAQDWYSTALDDWAGENVPDLLFPNSVRVYAEMRNDGTLAAVEQGWVLHLLRAQWQLDGTGCRPEVTQLVADDMGLPVKGADSPGAARVRGVSWAAHLRAALLQVPFGFMPFELVAEMRGGRARLVALAERMPSTVSEIHVNPRTGLLEGISQNLTPTISARKPQIPADRLALYTFRREGATFQGRSLFRSAYPSWLFKRELMRVLSTSSRRFGMGVPTVEWAQGFNPTPEQIAAAQRAASAARAGDQSGLSLPPGASLRLVGLSGGVPDTLAYIKWLDAQATRAALMSHLDLGGESSKGSHSLGVAFIESWTLAIESLAAEIADAATRQIAARIVDWNWGDDEPVPTVTASGVGSRREVTAESLQLLLNSGALSADPGLEAWVRREYRLPERTGAPVPAPTARGGTPRSTATPAADSGADVVTDGPKVAAAAPDAAGLDAEHAQAVQDMTAGWEQESPPLVEAMTDTVSAELAAGMIVGVGALVVPPAVTAALAGVVSAGMIALAEAAASGAVAEAGRSGLLATLPDGARERIDQQAQATTDLIVAGFASAAARTALGQAGADTDPERVAGAVRDALTDLAQAKPSGLVAGNLAAAATTAQGIGREVVFYQLPAGTRFRATEVTDRHRCEPCTAVDGTEYDSLADALADYPTGRYRACLGRDRCRGFFHPID